MCINNNNNNNNYYYYYILLSSIVVTSIIADDIDNNNNKTNINTNKIYHKNSSSLLLLNNCLYNKDLFLVDCTTRPATTTIEHISVLSTQTSSPPLSSIRTLLMSGNNLSIDILSWYNNNNIIIIHDNVTKQQSSALLLHLSILNLANTQLTDQSLSMFDIDILCPFLINLTLSHNHLKVII